MRTFAAALAEVLAGGWNLPGLNQFESRSDDRVQGIQNAPLTRPRRLLLLMTFIQSLY
jgi:hypothetical protein